MSRLWRSVQWPLLAVLAMGSFVLGMVGFASHFEATGVDLRATDAIYKSLQLFVMEWGGTEGEVPLSLEVARLMSPLVAGLAAAKGIAILFRDELARIRLRLFTRGHVVVCGLGDKGSQLARGLVADGWKVAGVEIRGDRARIPRIPLVSGDASDPAVLERAAVSRAAHLVALCGSDIVNAAVARAAREEGGPSMVTHLNVRDGRLAALLRSEALAGPSGRAGLEFFTIEESAARALLDSIGERPRSMAVVGMGRLGLAVLLEAARRNRNGPRPVTITAVDTDSGAAVDDLKKRHPGVGAFVEVTAIDLAPSSPEFEQGGFLLGPNGECTVESVVVCLDDEEKALSAALSLVQCIKQATVLDPGETIEVVVCLRRAADLADLVRGPGGDEVVRLRTFDPIAASLDSAMLTAGTREQIARAIHAGYLSFGSHGDPPAAGADESWVDLADEFREASRAAADGVGPGLHAIGCDLVPLVDWDADLIELTPAEVELVAVLEHRRWLAWKRDRGFRPGEISDEKRRTNKHLVPWTDLTEAARDRVRSFARSLPELLAAAGQKVVRLDRSPARLLHGWYVAGRKAKGETTADNPSLVPWDALPEGLKASNRDQVAHVRVKLFAIGCDLAPAGTTRPATLSDSEFELLAEMEHQRWVDHRRFDGWSLGPAKDAEAKTTPHLVPWRELAEEIKEIDREFARALPDLAAAMGKVVARDGRPGERG